MSDFFGFGKGRPYNTDESSQEIIQAINAYLPEVMQAIRGQYDQQAGAEVGVAEKYSPKIADIASKLLGDYGEKFAAEGRDISKAEQLSAADTEAAIMEGAGGRTARAGLALQKEADPEAFRNREMLMSELDTAFGALGGPDKLSAGEEEGIARTLGRSNWGVNSPGQSYLGAMTVGDNLARRRAEYNNLINLRNSVAPNLTSGIDMSALAGRRTVMPNFGLSQYTGYQTPGVDSANTTGNNFMNGIFNTELETKRQFYGAGEAQKGYTESLGNIVGSVGGMMGA